MKTSIALTNHPGISPQSRFAGYSLTATHRVVLFAITISLLGNLWREISFSNSIAMIGAYNLTIFDPIFLVWAVVLGMALSRARFPRSAVTLVAVLLMLSAIISFFRGLAVDWFATAFWVRVEVVLPVAILSAMLVPYHSGMVARVLRYVRIFATILALLSIARIVTFPGFPFLATTLGENEGRPLSVSGGLVIAIGLAIVLSQGIRDRSIEARIWVPHAVLLALGLVLSGQGTATIAGIAMATLIGMLEPRGARAMFTVGMLAAGSALIILQATAGISSLLTEESAAFIQQRLHNEETRQIVWDAFQRDFTEAPLLTQLFGYPGGSRPMIRLATGFGEPTLWGSSLHNHFYGQLANFGFFGAIGTCILVALAIAIFVRSPTCRQAPLSTCLALSMLAGCFIIGYSYELREVTSVPVFLAIFHVRLLKGLAAKGGAAKHRRPRDFSSSTDPMKAQLSTGS